MFTHEPFTFVFLLLLLFLNQTILISHSRDGIDIITSIESRDRKYRGDTKHTDIEIQRDHLSGIHRIRDFLDQLSEISPHHLLFLSIPSLLLPSACTVFNFPSVGERVAFTRSQFQTVSLCFCLFPSPTNTLYLVFPPSSCLLLH